MLTNSNLCAHRGTSHCCVCVLEVLPRETITHSSFLLPNCWSLNPSKEATRTSSLRGWHPPFPLGCDCTSKVSPEALPAQTSVLWQMGDTSWLLSKAWHKKMWRGYIIIFLATSGAKNSVTIFVLEPNCSQTASDVYSVEENYPVLGLCKSLGKNSQTGYFSSFYFIPFWNMCLDKWQAKGKWFGCIVEWYLNISSLSVQPPECTQPALVPGNWAESLRRTACLENFSSPPGVREFKDLEATKLLQILCSLDFRFCCQPRSNQEAQNCKKNPKTYVYYWPTLQTLT